MTLTDIVGGNVSSSMAAPGVRLGIPPVARAGLVCQAILLTFTVPLYPRLGLSVAWETLVPHVVLLALLFGVWLHHQIVPDKAHGSVLTDLLLAVLLLLLL